MISAETAQLFELAKEAFAREVEADAKLRARARAAAERAIRGLLLSLGFREVRFVDALTGRGSPAHQAPRPGASAPGADGHVLLEPLSVRELEVLRLVAAGLSNEEIGRALFVSQGTAKWHVHNLLGKSGARDRVGLAAWAHARALV